MNLQWLYYFNTIAELEHYTRAAERLHVSQSNLSHAIKELEEELGAELFVSYRITCNNANYRTLRNP